MERLEQPYRLFTDAVGKPLDAGYVYFGAAGQNPETSPITVYWDAAGTIPAAQPLRTSAGYIVNNGQPANVYFSGAYSEVVKDRNGVQLFADLNRNTNPDGYLKSLNASQVTAALGYTPANINSPTISGGAVVGAGPTDFDSFRQTTLTVTGTAGNYSASMQFERPGAYGIKAGLDLNNAFAIGGWSQGGNVARVYWDASGNQVTLGNVTAYSDARFKDDVQQMRDTVERTLLMQGVTYLDNQTGQRKLGAIAQQAMRAGFGEAVNIDDKGFFSLAYGQLALALVIENTRELHERIASLESQLQQLREI